MQPFAVLAALVLLAHLLWILFVLIGWIFTRHRPVLAVLHIVSLIWGVAVEIGPWPCPLTIAEQALEARAGSTPYRGSFIIHYLDALIYPNVPEALVTWIGAGVCLSILAIYATRFWRALRDRRRPGDPSSLPNP
ncbi:MAG TPA: DUF2784 domain-containing protein [Bryobacteraceae bacterium]|nr:DUF2784 domain-containing protein [Bryobacteraceae bacterium]